MFVVYFLIFSFILVNQAYAYYQLSIQIPNDAGQDEFIKTTMGIYPIFVISTLFLKNYVPGLGIGLALVIIMQLGLSFMIITACNRDGKLYEGFIYSIMFILWSIALSAMLSYFLIYLIAALVIGLALAFGLFLLFDMANQKFTYVKLPNAPEKEYVLCPHCNRQLPKDSPFCDCQHHSKQW